LIEQDFSLCNTEPEPQASIPRNKFLERNQFLREIDPWTSIPCEEIEDFRIVVVTHYVGGGGGQPYWSTNVSNTQTKWQLSACDENSIPAFKINIYGTYGQHDFILDSY
jgi:hypothetical protein